MRSASTCVAILLVMRFAGACSSSLQSSTPDGSDTGAPPATDGGSTDGPAADAPADGGPTDAGPDADFCGAIEQTYADVLMKAEECTIDATDQCGIQVRSGFWCNCTTFVNGNAETLAALVSEWVSAGCRGVCNGSCAQGRALVCAVDPTSSTGARCQPPSLLSLSRGDDGGTYAVPVGYEIDIRLQNAGSDAYGNDVSVSSQAATVLDVTIPAGPANPAGTTHLYRLRAVEVGDVVVQIPNLSVASELSPPYTVTLEIH
jgi:hypothetical protein